MKLTRPSSFSTSPEELLAQADDFDVEKKSPVENAIFLRDVVSALRKERLGTAGHADIYRELNLTIGRLEHDVRRLRRWRTIALFAIAIAIIAFNVACFVWEHFHAL